MSESALESRDTLRRIMRVEGTVTYGECPVNAWTSNFINASLIPPLALIGIY